MAEGQAKFLKGNLFAHVSVMSLTASVGLMAVFLVDFVDMIFISMLGKAELAAAVGYAGAILFFTTSFGIGMSIAAGALVARALGAGDDILARERSSHALIYGAVFGALFALAVWLNLGWLVGLVGAKGDTASLAVSFMQIVVPSLPFLMVGMMASAILRAHGDARRAMMAAIWGGVVNAVLDPILIFGLDLELTGAALASSAARIVIAVTAIVPLIRYYGGLQKPQLTGMVRDFSPIVSIAFPAILTQLATPVGQAYVTRTMAQYGEEAVAGMAIVGRLMPVAFGVIFALSGALGPIIGQNFGAGDMGRVRRAFKDGIIFTALVIVGISVVLFLARGAIADIFSATDLTRSLLYLLCGPLSLVFFFTGILFVSNAAFNNMGAPLYSTFTNWGRNLIAMVPLVWLGSMVWGAPGVLIGQSAAGVIFGVVSFLMARRLIDRGGQHRAAADLFGRESRLMTLFHARR